MSINKTSIPANSRLNKVVQKFDRTSGKPQLKGEVIYHKIISAKKIQSLWNGDIKKKLKEEQAAYKKWVEDALVEEYRLTQADLVKLKESNGLAGDKGVGMLATAALAKAVEDLNVKGFKKAWAIPLSSLEDMLTCARRYVADLDINTSAEDRIYAAKIYLIQRLVKEALPDLSDMKQLDLKLLVGNLHSTPYCRDPDQAVVQGLVNLLSSGDEPTLLNLASGVKLVRDNYNKKAI